MSVDQPMDGEALRERLREASALAEEGDWHAAFDLLRAQEADHPGDATLLCMLGVAASEVDQGLAYDYFRRALLAEPEEPELLVTLGSELARYDDPDAEGALRLAALSAPELPEARLQYGVYLAREGLLDRALEELAHARSLAPEDPRVPHEIAVVHLLRGDAEAAVDELEGAGGGEDEPHARLLLGLSLLRLGRLDEAAEALYRASRELPDEGEVHLACALASAAQEWWGEAWDALARAEGAAFAADPLLTGEAEDAIEAGAEASEAFLLEQVAPPLLRARLSERP